MVYDKKVIHEYRPPHNLSDDNTDENHNGMEGGLACCPFWCFFNFYVVIKVLNGMLALFYKENDMLNHVKWKEIKNINEREKNSIRYERKGGSGAATH